MWACERVGRYMGKVGRCMGRVGTCVRVWVDRFYVGTRKGG